MNQRVGDRRLLKLAAFLKTLPRKRFFYGSFVGHDWKGAPDLSCGTTACALGWAAAMPEFRRLGLRLKRGRYASYVGLGDLRDSFKSGAKIFGLTPDEASYLFCPGEYPPDPLLGRLKDAPHYKATPKQVAAHIERFVKSRASA